jgi:hypothetical protein
MVPVPHLSFLKLEECVELLVGRGDEAQFGPEVAKHVLEGFGDVLRWQVLDEFDQSHQLRLLLPELRVLLSGVAHVDEDVLVILPPKLYGLLYVFGEGILRLLAVTSVAVDTAVSSLSTPTSRWMLSHLPSFCRSNPSEHPRSMMEATECYSTMRSTARWRIWFMDMPM